MQTIRKLLVANRSEIAIRIFRTAAELGLSTVAVYAAQDTMSQHRFKADEAYQVGRGKGAVEAYLGIEEIIAVALQSGADAVHPGYGFLSESPEFAEACERAGLIFVGPRPQAMRKLGNKVAARDIAEQAGVPVIPATPPLPMDDAQIVQIARSLGYPLMLKASWGGGGRGMRRIEQEAGLLDHVHAARREAQAAFGKDELYLEKLIERAQHIEVQILGDRHGTVVHLFERDCSIQRRRQKVIERAPAPTLPDHLRAELCQAALKIARTVDYSSAGTVEFLFDADAGLYYFIEVNPRIQVEHTVTEMVTGIDLVAAQIKIAQGGRIGETGETGVPPQAAIRLQGHAVQCRITTENPANNFVPDFGRITRFSQSLGPGVRIDGANAYAGAVVTQFYDSLLEKVTVWAPEPAAARDRMRRALSEYRIEGVSTNIAFLEAVLAHPCFETGDYTTSFLDQTPQLQRAAAGNDDSTKLLHYIADVVVNGQAEVKGRTVPPQARRPAAAPKTAGTAESGSRDILERRGPEGLSQWMKAQVRPLVTDTTMRDAHQSLLATRLRSYDICRAAEAYSRGLPNLFSLECWGGATFDVSLRFLNEDPWERLARLRAGAPNILLQMLLRGANAVGYTNYPDNVVRHFIRTAAEAGVDVFRIFDCFNWVENMRVAIDAVAEAGKVAEGAICYSGNLLDPARPNFALSTYLDLAVELERAGCHILAIKDMAGLLKPAAAKLLIGELKKVTSLPIHLHMHDTSGSAAATVLAAVEAGVDAFDAAMDPLSGLTSQPALGSLVAALSETERTCDLSAESIRSLSRYWQDVRRHYAPFESDVRAGGSEVYFHEMPGGQFTNLREQARALGLEDRWEEISTKYRQANDLFGDIVKVTPSSKVVGDLALMMVSQGLSADDILSGARDVAFPTSVVEMLRGDLGRPASGWPEQLVRRVLGEVRPIEVRPGSLLPPADLEAERQKLAKRYGVDIGDRDLASSLMYPDLFTEYRLARRLNGPVSLLPTPVFFYGLEVGDEIEIELRRGKELNIKLAAVGAADADGETPVYFEVNGQSRLVRVPDRSKGASPTRRQKAQYGNEGHVGAPMQGLISMLAVRVGDCVKAGDALLCIEAMKMESTVVAAVDGKVAKLAVEVGAQVAAGDLLCELV